MGAITSSISAIASGAVGEAIQAIESALARSLPVALGFLASLLGLGGISQKIQAIIQKVRQPVAKAVDWVIDKGAKVVNKVGGKFNKTKFGSKVVGVKNAAQEKYKASKQFVEDKKAAGEKWFDDKKQAVHQATEKQKNRLLNSKAGKALTNVKDAAHKKLDALEKKRQVFKNKIDAAKEWPGKQLEKAQDKAAELAGRAKDKFTKSKLGKGLGEKWDKTKDSFGKQKVAVENKYDKLGNKVKDKFGFGKDKDKGKPAKDGKADEQTIEHKQAQLDLALAEAEQILSEKDATPDTVKAKLPKLQSKYQLKSAKLLKNKDNSYYIEAEINPKGDTKKRKFEEENNQNLLSPIDQSLFKYLKPTDSTVQELIADAKKIHGQLELDSATTIGTGKLSDGSYIVATNGRGGLSETKAKKLDKGITTKYKLLTSKEVPANTKTLAFSAGEEKQLEIEGVGEVKFKLESNKLSASLNEGGIQEAEFNKRKFRGKDMMPYQIDFNKEISGEIVRVARLSVKPSGNKYSAIFATYPHAETNMRRYAISQSLELTHSGSDKPTCYLCAVAHKDHKTTFGDITKASPNWTPLGS